MIVFFLLKNAGFFSEIFFMINYYLICKKYNSPFSINTINWLFKYRDGWHDYFNSLEEFTNDQDYYLAPTRVPEEISFCDNIDFTLIDYRNAMIPIFKLNSTLYELYKKTFEQFELDNYDAIFIRRGDKMIQESVYIRSRNYVDILLSKKKVSTIFVQTDDYNAYLEIKEYIQLLKLDIKVFTTCPEHKKGVHMFGINLKGSSLSKENDTYIKNQSHSTKPIIQYNNEEIYEHTKEMLIGLEICKNSDYLSLDLQSNVSRYLLLTHQNYNNVLDVQNTSIDYNKPILCPAIGIKYKY